MKTRKTQLIGYRFFDSKGIEKKLEKKASQGWLLDSASNNRWIYRAVEPKKLKFTVTYFPDSSVFDAGPTDGQLTLEEYALRDGWILAARYNQMQVFYNENLDATPIDTDPVVQVETINKIMKKNRLPLMLVSIALYLFIIFTRINSFIVNPIRFLSSNFDIFFTLAIVVFIVTYIIQSFGYIHWYKKALAEAENGVFLEVKSGGLAEKILYEIAFALGIIGIISYGSFSKVFLYIIVMVGLLILLDGFFLNFIKKRNKSRNFKRVLYFIIAFVVNFILMITITFTLISTGFLNNKEPDETFTFDSGYVMDVYHNDIPLRIEDFSKTRNSKWSTRADIRKSVLLTSTEYSQRELTNGKNAGHITYTIIEPKNSLVYDICRNSLVNKNDDIKENGIVVHADHYNRISPDLWDAEEAYQLYWDDGYLDSYIICYDDKIVEVNLFDEVSDEQIKLIAEKLK